MPGARGQGTDRQGAAPDGDDTLHEGVPICAPGGVGPDARQRALGAPHEAQLSQAPVRDAQGGRPHGHGLCDAPLRGQDP